jgi:hypothetical protein
VIPAMNGARNLQPVFGCPSSRLQRVILVDGPSTDDAVSNGCRFQHDIQIIVQTRKGNALACGSTVATGDIVVMLDAGRFDEPRRDTAVSSPPS